jgi:hypothetical protein
VREDEACDREEETGEHWTDRTPEGDVELDLLARREHLLNFCPAV